MKQYTVEISSSETIRRTHTLTVLAENWTAAIPKAIQAVRDKTDRSVVVGNPIKLSEENVEEIMWPTGSGS